MISVVIPLYNKEKQIAHTLQSVLSQTFQEFEIVIVNDGSTDGSVAEVEMFTDPRIRLIHQKNAGVSAARNRGIEEARGECVALLDADDEWDARYLEVQDGLMRKYLECDVFVTDYCFKEPDGTVKPTIIRNLHIPGDDGVMDNYFEVAAMSHPPICSITIMARKKAFQSIGGFPVGIKSGEDLLTWAKLACQYKIAYCKKPLAVFVESPSDSNVSKAVQRSGSEQQVLDGLLDLYQHNPNIHGLKDYVIRWYKIYCVLTIETERNHQILRVAREAMEFGGNKGVFCLLLLFGMLPSKLAKYIFFKLR